MSMRLATKPVRAAASLPSSSGRRRARRQAVDAPLEPEQATLSDVGAPVKLEGGLLHTTTVGPLALTGRTEPQRTLRVWVPDTAPLGEAYPSLVLLDGQNLFLDKLAFAGQSWRAAAAASAAIAAGEAPPFVVVGIDHAFNLRSLDYLPVLPGTGTGSFRPEAAAWPGGGADAFLSALHSSVLPLLRARFRLSSDPGLCAFGGSSFGGVACLHALFGGGELGATFSAALVESPSLWIDEGRWATEALLPAVAAPGRRLPARLWLAMGGREHSGTRPELLKLAPKLCAVADEEHLSRARALAAALAVASEAQGGACSMRFVETPAAAHSEPAWRDRLPAAIAFLMGPMAARARGEEEAPGPAAALPAPAPAPAPPRPPPQPRQPLREAALAALSRGALFFFDPPAPTVGQPLRLFLNRRAASVPLWERPNLRAHFGWDAWSGAATAHLLPAGEAGPMGQGADWWACDLPAPPAAAAELNLAFTDGDGMWENADGADFCCAVLGGGEEAPVHRPRSIAKRDTHEMAGGTLHIIQLGLREGADPKTAEARAARWQEEKILRVWTPPGWAGAAAAPPGGYPVLYISDANNLFEDWLAHQGVSWRAAETAAGLIASGQLPPFLIVGIDAVGAFRSLNYLPFPPGSGVGGFRPDCARWPGGNVDAYLERVAADILPLAEREFGASSARERRAFGGASFGGVAALHAAMTQGDVYAGFLCESPSLWVGEGRYLGLMEAPWAAPPRPDMRVFLGSGTREYSATRDEENEGLDVLLAAYHAQAARVLEGKGLTDGRLRFLCEEGAGHHEGAWGWRLGGALMHLFHGR